MANPFNKNFLKNAPYQFVVLWAAMGATLFRQSLTDPLFYGAEKNPGLLLEQSKYAVSPLGMAGIGIFLVTNLQINYRLYGLGRFVDGKSLKTPFGKASFNGKWIRAGAPGIALAIGYFVSSLFTDITQDKNLNRCLFESEKENIKPSEMKQKHTAPEKEREVKQHITPCEAFYLHWRSQEKWKHYAVDIGTLLGAGFLSSKVTSRIFHALQPTGPSRFLHNPKPSRTVNPTQPLLTGRKSHFSFSKMLPALRALGGPAQFVLTIWAFMEVHSILDDWVGQPVKEQWTAGTIKRAVLNHSNFFNRNLKNLTSYSEWPTPDGKEGIHPLFESELSKTTDYIKQLGHQFESGFR